MCFGAFTATDRCERCGRVHPANLADRCLDVCVQQEASQLETELAAYLDSAESRFFAWLAGRPAQRRAPAR